MTIQSYNRRLAAFKKAVGAKLPSDYPGPGRPAWAALLDKCKTDEEVREVWRTNSPENYATFMNLLATAQKRGRAWEAAGHGPNEVYRLPPPEGGEADTNAKY